MQKKKWSAETGGKGFGVLKLGEKPDQLPKRVFISLTRGEGLNFLQVVINQVLTLMVANQMKRVPGILYAELHGEFKNGKGTGQTMTVWDRKQVADFRNKGTHGFAMKFFTWIIHRKNTKTYYLTYSADEMPSVSEATHYLKEYGKFFDGGKLARNARPPQFTAKINP